MTTQPWAPKQKGFTIVELLIVIVVIAILAAITILAYNGIQQNAERSANFAAIRSYTQALQLMKVETDTLPIANSCLGPSGSYTGGACGFGGQTGTVNTTTNTQLAKYGLTQQPAIKNRGQQVVVIFAPTYYGEPALMWSVSAAHDCVASGARLYSAASSSWVDGAVFSNRVSTETRCYMSFKDL